MEKALVHCDPVLKYLVSFALIIQVAPLSAQWQQLNAPQGDTRALMTVGSSLYASGFGGGVSRSTDGGASWTPINTGLTVLDVPAIAHLDTKLIAGTLGGGCFLSTNDGATWSSISNGLPRDFYDSSSYTIIQALAVDGGSIFAGTYYGVYVTTDLGNSWVGINTGLSFQNVICLDIQGSTFFAGTNGGGLFRSTNGGTSWVKTDSTLPGGTIQALVAKDQQIFTAGTYGVRVSYDLGVTWQSCDLGQGAVTPWSLTIAGTKVFVGSYGSIHASADSGITWHRHDEGLTANFAQVFAMTSSETHVFAAVSGPQRTFWSRPLSDVLTSVGLVEFPSEGAGKMMSQCYPNPFNPSTTIQFDLPSSSMVSITIHDLTGRTLRSLVHGPLGPGQHRVVWNAQDHSSGVYVVRLQAGGAVRSRLVTLVK